jgi:hypothetical protein
MAADLMDLTITEVPTKHVDEHRASHIARQLYATARTSSRTRCKRMLLGLA